MKPSDEVYDVIQIGYGPGGQAFTGFAGRQGLRVAVFERYPDPYILPRATTVDHETMRSFQTLGCATQIAFDAIRPEKYIFFNKEGKTLMTVDWSRPGVSGWASYNTYQPELENALDAVARRHESVEIHHGWEAVDIRQDAEFAEVTLRAYTENGPAIPALTKTVRARYVVAADGGNSFARRHLGLDFEDLGFSQNWLVTDFRIKRRSERHQFCGQNCDPDRPTSIVPIGQRHRRMSFYVKPEEIDQPLSSDRTWDLVSPYFSRDDAELIRHTMYVYHSKVLWRWRQGRVLLMGDAAHLMPPYLGQGLCSGIRDAANLAWKLARVLGGKESDALLDTYEAERRPHALELTKRSAAMGRFVCIVDPEEARKRDLACLSGHRPPQLPAPRLTDGIFDLPADGQVATATGQLGPQARIILGGKEGLADELVGSGWQLITRSSIAGMISPEAMAFGATLPLTVLEVGPAGSGLEAIDIAGEYANYFDLHDVNTILVRPDFYVFGAAKAAVEIAGLLLRLQAKLSAYQ